MAARYFLLTSLPALGDLGSPPPLTPAGLIEQLDEAPRAAALAGAVLLADDLVQRDAFLAGELTEVEPAVLSAAQVKDQQPLPGELAPPASRLDESPSGRSLADRLWGNYFRFAAAQARRHNSELLARWVGFEVALRNAVAAERARALGLSAEDYTVATELAEPADLRDAINEWAGSANPLEGLRALDRRRWQWLAEHSPYYSFTDDELVAYAARLLLLNRWHRLARSAKA